MNEISLKIYYSALWRRFLAFVIDGLLFIPIVLGFNKVMLTSPRLYAAIYIPFSIIGTAYWVIGHAVWGKSVGKHCMGIRVAKLDGSRITWGQALLRQSVWIALSMLACIAFLPIYLKVPLEGYAEMAKLERYKLIRSMWPDWYPFIFKFQQTWMVCTSLAMLLNMKRRALHDFIAGTIVIQKKPTRRQLKREDLNQMDMNKEMKRLMKL